MRNNNRKLISLLSIVGVLSTSSLYAEEQSSRLASVKQTVEKWLMPQSSNDFQRVDLDKLTNFEVDTTRFDDLPIVGQDVQSSPTTVTKQNPTSYLGQSLDIRQAVLVALQRHPEISEGLSNLAAQNANIDVAKAQYYPQMSGGVSTGDLTSGERGRQLLNLSVSQMLYDFGKVKSGVDVQQTRLILQQAAVLASIDEIALEVAQAIINVKRYQELIYLSEQQINGLKRIGEIAQLRAKAGISSEADPIQAQSYLESAQSNLITQRTQLSRYQQRLRTLLGRDVSTVKWQIPQDMVQQSQLYQNVQANQVAKMIVAQSEVELAQVQKQQVMLSRYPTLNVKGSLSQAVNGVNPNNNKDNGLYSAVMLEANSDFFQGGAISSQTRAASYAEEAAKAKVQNTYMDIIDQVRMIQEQVSHQQRQMNILIAHQTTTVRTKELYQEQYKLGTRTAVDLLNAEQAIHVANMEIENTRYDIYAGIVQYIAVIGRTRDVYGLNAISIQGFEIQ